MSKKYSLGVGVISPLILELLENKVDLIKNLEIGLISSRRQVETKLLGNSYVASTEEMFNKKNNNFLNSKQIYIGRDHGGPGQGFKKLHKDLNIEEAMQESITSFERDIEYGFNFIHIDCCFLPENLKREKLIEISARLYEKNPDLRLETGEDEQSILPIQKKDLDIYLHNLVSDFEKRNLKLPEYIVVQLGSKTLGLKNIGSLKNKLDSGLIEQNIEYVKAISDLVHSYGFKIKMHNADYFEINQLSLLMKNGVDAINIAPEYATRKNKTVKDLLIKFEKFELLNLWEKLIKIDSNWLKWIDQSETINDPIILGGHYVWNEFSKFGDFQKFQTDLIGENISLIDLLSENMFSQIIELDKSLE